MAVWTPLESNPDVLTKYIHTLGVAKEWTLTDVCGLEPEMLEWIPKPVKSIILLFPCSEKYEKHRAEENERLAAEAQDHPKSLFYMRQFTSNACGTVALIHSVANNADIKMEDGALKKFLEKAKDLTPEERGKALENDEGVTESHQTLAQEGQTAADSEEKVYHHFIALVNVGGTLYELDGRKSFPVKHGSTTDESFVQDAARVCKEFMARDPEELRFTVMALTAAQN
ncbi:ubiquitin carboxyl-terminal hydrolase [Stomoxys calcitrans]|uniref:Ubiquitin carboxyl-terminal hydrolase n=1 Tax=Stomoxys calcitrans TaxID=35570 RepID=A0A1I8P8K9_STOCA|nr:ubiquitin carboxyl-terminal hydrolase [Stomoxys calcitrans]